MLTAKRIQSIAEKAARKLLTEPPPPLPAADVGAIPQTHNSCSDTCASHGCSGRWWKVPVQGKANAPTNNKGERP